MIILAIDPGHTESAYVFFDGQKLLKFGKNKNSEIRSLIFFTKSETMIPANILAIERIQSMGMAVGEEVFETVRWEVRFSEEWGSNPLILVPRIQVKIHHCCSVRAKDANIRQSLIDRFGPGKEKSVGTKKAPGPLYGVSGDVWSALAIATAVHDVGESKQWNLDRIRKEWLNQ